MSENFLPPATHLKLIVYKFDLYLILPIIQCSRVPEPNFEFGYPSQISGTRLPEIPDPALLHTILFSFQIQLNSYIDYF